MPLLSTDTESSVVYFCKDCQKMVNAKKEPRRYVYTCDICGTKNVAFGTKKSIQHFYHLEDTVTPAVAEGEKVKVEGL
ncbi:hypothetical protein HZA41_03005 [Candidatus Peregrinibacteria bacterium]|nr:hypothetical protein [Candidatus Peregrinibacteria bacterium]